MKIKQFAYLTNIDEFLSENYSACFDIFDNDSYESINGWFLIGEIEFDVNFDRKVLIVAAIKVLNEAEEKEQAEHQVKMNLLKEKKQRLLSITHQPLVDDSDLVEDDFVDVPYHHI